MTRVAVQTEKVSARRWVGTVALLTLVALLLFVGGVIAWSIADANDDLIPLLVYAGLTVILPGVVVALRRPTEARAWLTTWALGSLVAHGALIPIGVVALSM